MRVSFIVPMYGVAPYIHRCARSLFSQTLDSCEFIFVDDCSTDGTAEVLMQLITEEFAHLQNRITLVRHASNLGVSETRNTALKIAKGDFVIFVDGDDWIDPELAEELIIEQLIDESDLVFSSYDIVTPTGHKSGDKSIVGGRRGAIQLLVSQSFLVPNRIWGILIRRSLFENKNLCFDPQITMGEDMLLLVKLLYHARGASQILQPLYLYNMENPDSAMKNISQSNKSSYVFATQQVELFISECTDGDSYRTATTLLHLNLKKWLMLRREEGMQPFALLLRSLLMILNSLWWLRWRVVG